MAVFYVGGMHGRFRHLIQAVEEHRPEAIVLLGDMEPSRPLHEELALAPTPGIPLWLIHGHQGTDSDLLGVRVWEASPTGGLKGSLHA